MRVLFAATLILGLGTSLPARAQRSAPQPAGPQRIVLSDGRTWERIPLQYMDVRVLTALTGAPNLPTEMDLLRMRYGGMMGRGTMGGYAGYGGLGYGAPRAGYPGGRMGAGPFGGQAIFGNPADNSLLVGPGGQRGAGAGSGVGSVGNNRLFPGLILFGDPSTNSLIVDP